MENVPKIENKAEQLLKDVLLIINELELDYNLGGGEDESDRAFQLGKPDFDGARKKMSELILGNSRKN